MVICLRLAQILHKYTVRNDLEKSPYTRVKQRPKVDPEVPKAIWLEALLVTERQILILWIVLFRENLKISPLFSTSGLAIP